MTREEAFLKKKTNYELTIDVYEELERSEEDIATGRTISGKEALKEIREKYGLQVASFIDKHFAKYKRGMDY